MSLRVAAYCRVSTDREDQANSLLSQQEYFRTYIQGHADWCLTEIFVDEGISGTSTRRRAAFNRMIREATAQQMDLILTKEVSRFARNTVDTLEFTRKLKSLGVGVIFTSDNIDTRDNDGELRLTIMASMAQEESRKTSERVKWGQKRRMEAGVVFGNNSTYGFHTEHGRLTAKEDEAAVIQLIFRKFLSEGKGTHVIARELYEEGIAPPQTATGKWSCVMVRRILRNEKYVGDLLQKKFITTDYLSHKKEENKGREEQVYLRDHHTALVDRDTWQATQAELLRRNAGQDLSTRYSGRYWCSGKIHCGTCGSRFVLRKTARPNGDSYKIWGCHSRVHYGNWKQNGQGETIGCSMRMLNDKTLITCVQHVLDQLDIDREAIVTALVADFKRIQAVDSPDDSARLTEKRTALEQKKDRALDAYFSQDISREDLQRAQMRYDSAIAKLEEQRRKHTDMLQIQQAQQTGLAAILQAMRAGLAGSEPVFGAIMECITVYQDYIAVRVQCLPAVFKLFYSTGGTRENYTTMIERTEIE